MKTKCCLCDTYEEIDPNSQLAKRYRNHPLKTHLCSSCNERIKQKTLARLAKHTHEEEATQHQ